MTSDRVRTAVDGDVQNEPVCKTVYRRFESRPWDHSVASKSAPAGADFPVSRAADSYGDSYPWRVPIIGGVIAVHRAECARLVPQNGVKRVRSLLLHRHRDVRVEVECRADSGVARRL